MSSEVEVYWIKAGVENQLCPEDGFLAGAQEDTFR